MDMRVSLFHTKSANGRGAVLGARFGKAAIAFVTGSLGVWEIGGVSKPPKLSATKGMLVYGICIAAVLCGTFGEAALLSLLRDLVFPHAEPGGSRQEKVKRLNG